MIISYMSDTYCVAETVQALSAPIEKLNECVAIGLGKVYEPCYVRQMSLAKGDEFRANLVAIHEKLDITIGYQEGLARVEGRDVRDLVDRAVRRVGHQELTKQINIESVVGYAALKLKEVESVSSDSVDEDWLIRFFDYAAEVNSKDTQKLWANILSEEIIRPGSYSLRTLDVLRNLSKCEAELFQRIEPLIIDNGKFCFLSAEGGILTKWGISFVEIMALNDAGLISSSSATHTATTTEEKAILFHAGELICAVGCKNGQKVDISYNVYTLTRAGEELRRLVSIESDKKYFIDVVRHIRQQTALCSFGVHVIETQSETNFTYKSSENLLFE